jgi:hypothetical protein
VGPFDLEDLDPFGDDPLCSYTGTVFRNPVSLAEMSVDAKERAFLEARHEVNARSEDHDHDVERVAASGPTNGETHGGVAQAVPGRSHRRFANQAARNGDVIESLVRVSDLVRAGLVDRRTQQLFQGTRRHSDATTELNRPQIAGSDPAVDP